MDRPWWLRVQRTLNLVLLTCPVRWAKEVPQAQSESLEHLRAWLRLFQGLQGLPEPWLVPRKAYGTYIFILVLHPVLLFFPGEGAGSRGVPGLGELQDDFQRRLG